MPLVFQPEGQPRKWEEPLAETKPFCISKRVVWEAWLRVKADQGAPGVDGDTSAQFEKRLEPNLYKIWNRMSSGTYFPPLGSEGDDPEERRRGAGARYSHGGRPCRSDGVEPVSGASGRTSVPPGLVRIPAEEVSSRSRWRGSKTLLAV